MSKQHPVIAITGSSGAGTTTVRKAFEHIFFRLDIMPLLVDGSSFHRYDWMEMRERIADAAQEGRHFSHFSVEANLLSELENAFREYGETGVTRLRRYIRSRAEGESLGGLKPGSFTPWESTPADSDLLFYEGLHGGTVTDTVDIAKHTDLLVGVVPIVNLEWIQKIHSDTSDRGYDADDVTETILRRMDDYVRIVTPQFSQTDINFQRVPTVDTSNPFIARDIPNAGESRVMIRFQDPAKFDISFPYLLAMLKGSYMSRYNTIVIAGGQMGLAMEIIFRPILERMIAQCRSSASRGVSAVATY
jgi:phosphoribulokinase